MDDVDQPELCTRSRSYQSIALHRLHCYADWKDMEGAAISEDIEHGATMFLRRSLRRGMQKNEIVEIAKATEQKWYTDSFFRLLKLSSHYGSSFIVNYKDGTRILIISN